MSTLATSKIELREDQKRENVLFSIYGVKLLGRYDRKSKKVSKNSVLELFMNDYNRYKNKGKNSILELYKKYSYAIFYMYVPSSIANNVVYFKNIIKDNGGKYQADALNAFDIEGVYAPIRDKSERTKKELKEKVKDGSNIKIDPTEVINEIRELKRKLKEKDYTVRNNQSEEQVRAYHILAMLGMATGRRFTELLKTFEIEKRGRKLTFSGLLKGNVKTIEGNIIELSYKEVKGYLSELREFANTENMTEAEVNSKYAKVFNNGLKRLGFINVKSTRQKYSIAGYELFKKENEGIEDTITRILGHKERLLASLHYTKEG